MADTGADPDDDVDAGTRRALADLARLNNEMATLQRDLAKRNAALERLDAQKNRFLGMAAHDLRNPLGVIGSYADLLAEEARGRWSPEHCEMLEAIAASSRFMLSLVNDLLDVSVIAAGQLRVEPVPLDLAEQAACAAKLNAVLAGRKGIDVRLHPAPGPLPCRADPAKIEQVLNNLLSNAIKFSPRGTTIDVRVLERDDRVGVEVADQGPGIPKQEQSRLFQDFGRTSVQSTGGEKSTGLGLAIAARIVKAHDGGIELESEPGQGARFRFWLPRVEASAAGEPLEPGAAAAGRSPAGRHGGGTTSRRLRVLVADDVAANRRLVQRLVERSGHDCQPVADGDAVLARLEKERFDLVLLDLEMPGLGGLDTAREIRRRWPDGAPRLVALTGHAAETLAEEADEAGLDGVLSKPVGRERLAALLAELATAGA